MSLFSTFNKITTLKCRKLIGVIVDELLLEQYGIMSATPDWFSLRKIPIFNLVPRNFQISLLSRLLSSILLKSTPSMKKELLFVGAYVALFKYLGVKLEIEVDKSIIRKECPLLGGVCHLPPKKKRSWKPKVSAKMTSEDREVPLDGSGDGIKGIYEEYSKPAFLHSKMQQRKEIRKSMKKKGIPSVESMKKKKYEPCGGKSINSVITSYKDFLREMMNEYERPNGYYIDELASQEDIDEAFHFRKVIVVESGEFIHQSHSENCDFDFWDRLVQWVLIPRFAEPPDFYSYQSEDIHSDRLIYGELDDRKKDPGRYDFLRVCLMKEVLNYKKFFIFEEFCRSYYVLQLFGYERSKSLFSNQCTTFRVVKSIKDKEKEGARNKKNKDEKVESMKDWLENQLKNDFYRVYVLFHSIMIDKNRNYNDLDDQYMTLMEIEDKDILFPLDYLIERELYDEESIEKEFGEKFMGFSALRCKTCFRSETIFDLHRKCGGCKVVRYCSVKCQRNDWKRHKPQCNPLDVENSDFKREEHDKKGIDKDEKKMLDDRVSRCEYCNVHDKGESLKVCRGCKVYKYCSLDCQNKDWKKHKPECLELRKKRK